MKYNHVSFLRSKFRILLAGTVIPFILVAFTGINSESSPGLGIQQQSGAKGWWFGGKIEDFKPGTDSTLFQHGRKCATLESVHDNPADFCTLMQTIMVKEYAGKRVRMTGYIKSQGSDVKGAMWIRVDDFGNKISADFDNMMDRPVTGNSDWQKCEIVFDVPEKAVVALGFILQGTGKIWVDNVSLEVVPD